MSTFDEIGGASGLRDRMYDEKCDDVLKLQDALRAVYALAGEDKEIARIVHEAIAETGGES